MHLLSNCAGAEPPRPPLPALGSTCFLLQGAGRELSHATERVEPGPRLLHWVKQFLTETLMGLLGNRGREKQGLT